MNREYPEAPIVAVGVVVKRGRQVLLVQRLNEPSRGRWSLPGGAVELGETVPEAARREVQEECGLQVEPGEVLAVVPVTIYMSGASAAEKTTWTELRLKFRN